MWSGSEIFATERDFGRWLEVLNLLSLVRIGPFLADMEFPEGVPISAIRDFARHCTVKMVPLIEAASSGWLEEARKSIGLELIDLGRRIGDPSVQKMVSWIDAAFPREHLLRVQARLWTSVLTRTLCVGRAGRTSGPFPSMERNASILGVFERALCSSVALMARVDEADEMPKDAWDEFVYGLNPPGCSPMDSLEDAINRVHFFRAWKEVRVSIGDREADLLEIWVRQCAAELNMPPSLIERPEIHTRDEQKDNPSRG